MIKLDNRLSKIYNEISFQSLCDIGCDHGKLAVYALLSGKEKVIATDISKSSLAKAKRLSLDYGLNLDIRLCDGLEKIESDEVETVVIAGMGGELIREIISNSLKENKHFKQYVLSPNTYDNKLRHFLFDNGFGIKSDYTIKDGKKFYTILVAGDYSINKCSPLELEFGLNCLSCNETLERMQEEYENLKDVKDLLDEGKSFRFNLLLGALNESKRIK